MMNENMFGIDDEGKNVLLSDDDLIEVIGQVR